MKKLVKVILGVIVVLVVLALIALFTLPYTIDPIVKTAASTGGPKLLGVPVSVGNVALSPLAGRMTISKLTVGNPKGYSENLALSVDLVDVELDVFSLMSDTILVKRIQIDVPAISYETREGKSNFDAIQANIKKSSEEDKTKPPADQAAVEKKPGKKVIVELFALNNAKVSYASALTLGQAVTLPLPSVTVRDIGKASGGTSFTDAVTKIINEIGDDLVQAVAKAAGQAPEALKNAIKDSSEAAKAAANAAADTAKDAAKTATDTARNTADTASDAAKSVSGAAGDATKKATDAAGDAAKSVTDIFK